MGSPSLSITSIEGVLPSTNTTINSALLYYENPTGNVSALLQRTSITFADECVDITSQASESLPNEFRNSAGQTSNTLYESDTNATYSTPFTSGANFTGWDIGALFYSPSTLDDGTPIVSGGGIAVAGYTVASRIGRFSAGMLSAPRIMNDES